MENGSTNVSEQEKAECWVVQYRVRPRNGVWGAWATGTDYRRKETALKACDDQRAHEEAQQAKFGKSAEVEWRVLHVTQEVVY